MKTICLKKSIINIIILFYLILFVKCDTGNPVSVNINDPKMVYGTTKSYQISSNQNYELIEDITGYKFTFPNGGSGELIVKEILQGPEPTIKPIKWFSVSYGGDDTLLITVPHNKSDYDFLCSYSNIRGASLTGISPNKKIWHSISNFIESDSEITYIIPHSITKGVINKKECLQTIPETDFAFVQMRPNSNRAEVIELVKQTVKQDVDYIGTFLSDEVKQTYNNRYKLLKLTWTYVSDKVGSYFAFSNGWFGYYGDFGFEFSYPMKTAVIHHEAGHMINYLLWGVVNYEALWSRFGDIEHIAFTPLTNGREQGLQEDMAYIIENYIADENSLYTDLTAKTTGIWDKVKARQNDSKVKYTAHPQYIDFPAIEGFAAALVHQLTANNTQMYTFDCVNAAVYYKRILRTPAPVLNISTQDVFCNILLRNPLTVNDIMKYTLDYFSTHSPDKLPKFLVRAEAIGWSYYGKVKIVDSKGNLVPNAEVLPVMQTGSSTRDFWTVSSFKTDSKGECIVPRIYPGSQILRVFYNYQSGKFLDSADFPLTVDWTKPTNVQLDLGTLKIGKKGNQIVNLNNDLEASNSIYGSIDKDTVKSKICLAGKLDCSINNTCEFFNNGDGNIGLNINIKSNDNYSDTLFLDLVLTSILNKYSIQIKYDSYTYYINTFEKNPIYLISENNSFNKNYSIKDNNDGTLSIKIPFLPFDFDFRNKKIWKISIDTKYKCKIKNYTDGGELIEEDNEEHHFSNFEINFKLIE
ncbi:MAG: hypothetical protein V1779_17460 [bacterium]